MNVGANTPPLSEKGDVVCALDEISVRLGRQSEILSNIEEIVFSPRPSCEPQKAYDAPRTLPDALKDICRRIDSINDRLSELEGVLRGLFRGEDFHLV